MCTYMWVQCVGVHSVRDVYKHVCMGKPGTAVERLQVVFTEASSLSLNKELTDSGYQLGPGISSIYI